MQTNTITSIHNKGEIAYATVNLTPNDIRPRDWAFLKQWAEKLGVSIDVLLKRILITGIEGQLYAERILKFENLHFPQTNVSKSRID